VAVGPENLTGLTVAGETVAFEYGGTAYPSMTGVLDPSQSPRWIDLSDQQGVIRGVYLLVEDTLAIALARNYGQERPASLEPGPAVMRLDLRRAGPPSGVEPDAEYL
jgi:uncharacterized protein (TIGR03067 family)